MRIRLTVFLVDWLITMYVLTRTWTYSMHTHFCPVSPKLCQLSSYLSLNVNIYGKHFLCSFLCVLLAVLYKVFDSKFWWGILNVSVHNTLKMLSVIWETWPPGKASIWIWSGSFIRGILLYQYWNWSPLAPQEQEGWWAMMINGN